MFATKYQTARPPHVLTQATLLMCLAFMDLSVQHFLLRSIHYFMAVRLSKTLTARWCFTLRCYRGERKNHICGTEFKILWVFFLYFRVNSVKIHVHKQAHWVNFNLCVLMVTHRRTKTSGGIKSTFPNISLDIFNSNISHSYFVGHKCILVSVCNYRCIEKSVALWISTHLSFILPKPGVESKLWLHA